MFNGKITALSRPLGKGRIRIKGQGVLDGVKENSFKENNSQVFSDRSCAVYSTQDYEEEIVNGDKKVNQNGSTVRW